MMTYISNNTKNATLPKKQSQGWVRIKKMSISVSVKKATGKTNINHNNRKFKEWEKEKNSHIDYERSKENKYLVQKDIRDVYKEEFGDALEKYNKKKKRNDR